jgi:hypothetical protein
VPFTDQPFVQVFDTTTFTSREIYTGESGQGVAVSRNGRAYVTVAPLPVPPVPGATAIATYFGSMPGGALPGSSGSPRPVDAPGAVYVYDARTLRKLGEITLPSNAYMPAVIDNPPTPTRC